MKALISEGFRLRFMILVRFLNLLYFRIAGRWIFPPGQKEILIKYFSRRNRLFPSRLCYAPFSNIYIKPDGSVQPCCFNHSDITGNLKDEGIMEIWAGNSFNNLRNTISSYKLEGGCFQCKEMLNEKTFFLIPARDFDCNCTGRNFPAAMELELSNRCNLECIMCTGILSEFTGNNNPMNKGISDNVILEKITPVLKHVKRVKFIGGEPLLHEINFRVMEILLSINPRCSITIQTNATILNRKVKEILEKGRFNIGVSIDSLNRAGYENIRLHADFDTVMSNIRYFNEYCTRKRTTFGIAVCPLRLNWKELPEFIRFGNSLNALVHFNRVTIPNIVSLTTLPSRELKDIYDYLNLFRFTYSTGRQKNNSENYKSLVNQINRWYHNAFEQETVTDSLKDLSDNELLLKITGNLNLTKSPENDRTVRRLHDILEAHAGKPHYRKLLVKLFILNPAKLSSVLTHLPEDKTNAKIDNFVKTGYFGKK